MKTNHSLKNLSKLELLELLSEQEQEIQELKRQLEQKNQLIQQRTLRMENAGNIAEAALSLNGVFEAAQKAADQYVQSVKQMILESLEKDGTLPSTIQEMDKQGSTVVKREIHQRSFNKEPAQKVTAEEILKSLSTNKILQQAASIATSQESPAQNKQEGKR